MGIKGIKKIIFEFLKILKELYGISHMTLFYFGITIEKEGALPVTCRFPTLVKRVSPLPFFL